MMTRKSLRLSNVNECDLPTKPLTQSNVNRPKLSFDSMKQDKQTLSDKNESNTGVNILLDDANKENSFSITTNSASISEAMTESPKSTNLCEMSTLMSDLALGQSIVRNGSPVQRNDEPLLEKPENINPDFPLTSSVSPCILSDKRDDNHQVFDSDTSTVSDTSTDSDESKQSIALPPPSASKTEISDFYWKMCYGQLSSSTPNQTEIPSGSWSAKRAPPIKSCLSSRKKSKMVSPKPISPNSKESQITPPSYNTVNPSDKAINTITTTPKTTLFSNDKFNPPSTSQKSVKFGYASAAEFDCSKPALELTPLPKSFAEKRYSLAEKVVEEEEQEMNEETKINNDVLSTWEENFDSFLDDSDTDEYEDVHNRKHSIGRRKQNRRKQKRNRSTSRRSSSIFSRNGGSLVDLNDDDDDNEDDEYSNGRNNTVRKAWKQDQNEKKIESKSRRSSTMFSRSGRCLVNLHDDDDDKYSNDQISFVKESWNEDGDSVNKEGQRESPIISPVFENKANRRRSSSLFQDMNKSGGFTTSPDENNCLENETSSEKKSIGSKDHKSTKIEIEPNQLDYALKKHCPHDKQERKINIEITKMIQNTKHEIRFSLLQTLQTMLCTKRGCNKIRKQTMNLSRHFPGIDPLSLISYIVHDKSKNNHDNLSKHFVVKSEIVDMLNQMRLPTLHIQEQIEMSLCDATMLIIEDSILEVDDIERQNFSDNVFPLIQTDSLRCKIDHVFHEVYLIALSDLERWELENLGLCFDKILVDNNDFCEKERIWLNTNVQRVNASCKDLIQEIRNEEESIAMLKNEIEILSNSITHFELIEAAEQNATFQIKQMALSSIMPYTIKKLTFDNIEILFPRNNNIEPIFFQALFCWSRETNETNDLVWLAKVQIYQRVEEDINASPACVIGPDLLHDKNSIFVGSIHNNFKSAAQQFAQSYIFFIFQSQNFHKVLNCECVDIQASILTVNDIFSAIYRTKTDIENIESTHSCSVCHSLNQLCLELRIPSQVGKNEEEQNEMIQLKFIYCLSKLAIRQYGIRPARIEVLIQGNSSNITTKELNDVASHQLTKISYYSNISLLNTICAAVSRACAAKQ